MNPDMLARAGLSAPDYKRYLGKIRISSGCWEWQGTRDAAGYGRFQVGVGKQRKATHIMWELTYGPIPEGMFPCHRCDNPSCVRPSDLFLGTKGDNNRDRHAKGRDQRGERHYRAKLTDEQVREARRRYVAGGVTQRALAMEYGLSLGGMQAILAGRNRRCA